MSSALTLSLHIEDHERTGSCMLWLCLALRALMGCCVQVTTLFPHYVQSSMTEEVRFSQPFLHNFASCMTEWEW